MTDIKLSFDNWVEAEMKKNFKLSEPFVYNSSSLLIYKFIALTSLFQKRRIVKREREYHLSYTPSDWNVNKHFDPWKIDLYYSTDFKEQSFEEEIDGTEKIIECYSCSGAGKNTCNNCRGKKELKCSSCYGSCQIKCSSCSGRGDITCNNCYGRPASKHECTRCGGRGIISCSNCRNGYYTCSNCAGRGMVRCETCNGNGEITCHNCNGKGRLVEYSVLTAKNFVSVEHFDILENGLQRQHVEHFNPLAALEDRYKLIEINKETINIDEVPKEVFQLNPEKLQEIFEEHRTKTLDILKQANCHRLEMMFGGVSIDDFYKVEYSYGGKSFEVIFFKNENDFYAPENPWEDFRKNVETEIEQLYRTGNKKSTLRKINLYKKENISTVRIEAIKKEILNSYIKRDVLVFALPYIFSSIILGGVFNASSDDIPTVFILTLIPFGWIIYRRHKSRKDKLPEDVMQFDTLDYSSSNRNKYIIGSIVCAFVVLGIFFLFQREKAAIASTTTEQSPAVQEPMLHSIETTQEPSPITEENLPVTTDQQEDQQIGLYVVSSSNAYFYNDNEGKEKRKGYLTKGDLLQIGSIKGRYGFAVYIASDEKLTKGWIDMNELTKSYVDTSIFPTPEKILPAVEIFTFYSSHSFDEVKSLYESYCNPENSSSNDDTFSGYAKNNSCVLIQVSRIGEKCKIEYSWQCDSGGL